MTTFTPDADANYCVHCGQVCEAHHGNQCCYTDLELLARLRFFQREGRWPGPDEGCVDILCGMEDPP
jgi:hypothetical protein